MLNRLRAQIRRAILPVADMGLSHQPPGALVFPDDVPPVLAVMALQDGTTPKLLDKSMFPVPPAFPVGFEIFDAAGNPINAANPLQVTSTPTVDQTNQARVYKSTATVLATATAVSVAFDTARFNPGGLWVAGVNPSRLTSKVTGVYSIAAAVAVDGSAAGYVQTGLRLNGTTYIALDRRLSSASVDPMILALSSLWTLNIGDYIELVITQNSGGNLNLQADLNYSPELAVQRVG